MAIRNTIQLGHPALKAGNKIITDFGDPKLTQLITDLKDTMYKLGLIGIAAPQIGENYMVFITEPRETESRPADQADEFRVYFNPKIVWESDEKIIIWEGCGSVTQASLFGPVLRPKIVEIEAQDILGKKKITPPDETKAIKNYVRRKYNSDCRIKLQRGALIVSVPNSGLAATMQLEKQLLIKKCNLGNKKLVIRNER